MWVLGWPWVVCRMRLLALLRCNGTSLLRRKNTNSIRARRFQLSFGAVELKWMRALAAALLFACCCPSAHAFHLINVMIQMLVLDLDGWLEKLQNAHLSDGHVAAKFAQIMVCCAMLSTSLKSLCQFQVWI